MDSSVRTFSVLRFCIKKTETTHVGVVKILYNLLQVENTEKISRSIILALYKIRHDITFIHNNILL